MRKLVVFLVLLIFLTPSYALKKKIAILPFDDGSIPHWWGTGSFQPGRGIADTVTSFLVKTKALDVIERQKMDQVMKELGLQASGMTADNTNALLGKLQGVNLLLMGTINEFAVSEKEIKAKGLHLGRFGGGSVKTAIAKVKIDVRVVDVQTGKIVEAYQASGEKKKKGFSISSVDWASISFDSSDFKSTILGQATNDASANVAQFLTDKFGSKEGYVIKVDGSKILIDFAKGEVNEGDVLDLIRLGEKIIHPVTGAVLGQDEKTIGKIKVTKVLDNWSEAEVVEGTPKVGDAVRKAKKEK